MIRFMVLIALSGLALIAGFLWNVREPGAEAKPHGAPIYIALGDEIAFGRGLTDRSQGYVSQFGEFLQSPHGLSRETSVTNLAADDAAIWEVTDRQLPVALDAIESRNSDGDKKNDVEVVTIDAGLPELFGGMLICSEGSRAECVHFFGEVLNWHELFMDYILEALRTAGGENLQIIVMTNYNPFLNPECYFHFLAPAWDIGLEGSPEYDLEQGMNDITRRLAAQYGASVADVYELMGAEQLRSNCGETISPNAAGHAVIAEEFADAFEAKKAR